MCRPRVPAHEAPGVSSHEDKRVCCLRALDVQLTLRAKRRAALRAQGACGSSIAGAQLHVIVEAVAAGNPWGEQLAY